MMQLFQQLYVLSGLALFLAGLAVMAFFAAGVMWVAERMVARRSSSRTTHPERVRAVASRTAPLAELGGYYEALVPVYLPAVGRSDRSDASDASDGIGRYPSTPGAAAPSAQDDREPARDATVYWISSATLAEAYRYLVRKLPGGRGEPEWMLAVTGIRLADGTRTLEKLIEIKLAGQSAVRASFDMADFTRVAVLLHEHGQALHAILHSHRFAGQPGPSGVDLALQAQLEAGGYPAIQAVFSEDGYVTFFGGQRPWAIRVHGQGVAQVGPRSWRITERETLPGLPEV